MSLKQIKRNQWKAKCGKVFYYHKCNPQIQSIHPCINKKNSQFPISIPWIMLLKTQNRINPYQIIKIFHANIY